MSRFIKITQHTSQSRPELSIAMTLVAVWLQPDLLVVISLEVKSCVSLTGNWEDSTTAVMLAKVWSPGDSEREK